MCENDKYRIHNSYTWDKGVKLFSNFLEEEKNSSLMQNCKGQTSGLTDIFSKYSQFLLLLTKRWPNICLVPAFQDICEWYPGQCGRIYICDFPELITNNRKSSKSWLIFVCKKINLCCARISYMLTERMGWKNKYRAYIIQVYIYNVRLRLRYYIITIHLQAYVSCVYMFSRVKYVEWVRTYMYFVGKCCILHYFMAWEK